MTLEFKRIVVAGLAFLFLGSLVAVSIVESKRHHEEKGFKPPVVLADAKGCVDCHTRVTPLAVQQWAESKHGQQGISCVTCHGAKEPAGFAHHEAQISSIVSPKTCAVCHGEEAAEMARSAHGAPHPGFEVRLLASGKPDPKTWPAPLIGRINPDGSAGTCTACHGRHRFELADARRPETCETCHAADGSAEAWRHSPHGAVFLASTFGETPRGPSCVTCHMAGKAGSKSGLHDVSARVTWVVTAGSKPTQRKDAEARRDGMFDRCLLCHGNGFLEATFDRIDGTFAATMPAQAPAGAPPYLLKPAAWPHLSPVDAAQLRQLTGH